MEKFTAAVIQMDSQDHPRENLRQASFWVEEAAKRGASLAALPETVNYIGTDPCAFAEQIPGGETFRIFSKLAKKHGIWLHCGSITENREGEDRPFNTVMLLNPAGELAARYAKIHPFDAAIQDGPTVRESDRICPGDRIVTVDAKDVGRLGLAVCYDLRFPELFRLMALEGAQIFVICADFTTNTGKDHWEVLLRARAIENGCYVLAAGQIGVKPKYQSYGNSMIIDPWGKVIARASDRPGVALAELDLDYLSGVRRQIQTLENRRPEVYRLEKR